MSSGGSGPFGATSTRVWTVLGGMATVVALIWTIAFANDRPLTDPSASGTRSAETTPNPSPPGDQRSKDSAPSGPSITARPTPTRTQPPSAGPTGPPGEDLAAARSVWIAQLASVKISETARLSTVLANVRGDVPGAQVLLSSEYASLVKDYWVVYYLGGFNNGREALAYCAAHGRSSRSECIGRLLSHDAADFRYQCYPADSTNARCENG